MKRYDLISSLLCLCIGLAFVAGGVKMGMGPLQAPEAGFFPVVIGAVLSLLSATLLLAVAIGKAYSAEKHAFWKEEGAWIKVSQVIAALIAYMFILEALGYIATTIAFIVYLLRGVNKKSWRIAVVMALLVALGSYALFKLALGVYLPRGPFQW